MLPGTATVDGGRLTHIGGVAVETMAERFGTPLYILDHADVVARMRQYRTAFGADVDIEYASKALCVTAVLQIAAAEGLHVDVASEGELETAVRADVPPDRIVLHGNNKSARELRRALDLRVGRIVVDSFDELDRLTKMVDPTGPPAQVWLRTAPGVGAGGHEHIRTGQDDTKFGFPRGEGGIEAAVAAVGATDGLRLRGLHCHVGSQVTDGHAYDKAVGAMVAILAGLRDRLGIEMEELNLGGGLGIAYLPSDPEPDIAGYAAAIRSALTAACARHGLAVPRLAVEPGRSIVGRAGVTLYEVGTVKEVPGVRTFAAVDGGMSDNLRPALYDARYTFVSAGGGPAVAGTKPFSVVGKHCESGDLLGTDVLLPEDLASGDLIAVAATGAYTSVLASNYNRLPRPAMVLVRDGRADLIVRRESIDDVLSRDVPLHDPGHSSEE